MEDPNLSDVRTRRSQIAARRRDIAAEDAMLATEDAELEVAERVLVRLSKGSDVNWHQVLEGAVPRRSTTRDLIHEVLSMPDKSWWTAAEIQPELSKLKGAEVPMGTISPTLTAMKTNGEIVRNGMRIALASRVPPQSGGALPLDENEPPASRAGGSETDEGHASSNR